MQLGAQLGASLFLDRFILILDGRKFCTTDSLFDAVCAYLTIFYLFNLKNPANIEKTLRFVLNYIFNFQESNVCAAVRRVAVKYTR